MWRVRGEERRKRRGNVEGEGGGEERRKRRGDVEGEGEERGCGG